MANYEVSRLLSGVVHTGIRLPDSRLGRERYVPVDLCYTPSNKRRVSNQMALVVSNVKIYTAFY